MKPYYYTSHTKGDWPRVRHVTLESARDEAMKLAGENPGENFEILACIGITLTTTPSTFWMDGVTPPSTTRIKHQTTY